MLANERVRHARPGRGRPHGPHNCRVPLAPVDDTSSSAMDHVAAMVTGARGKGYSGADLTAVLREAGVRALRRALGTVEEMDASGPGLCAGVEKDNAASGVVVLVEDFEAALEKVAPSVSKAQRRRYEALRETFGGGFGRKGNVGEGEGACGIESTNGPFQLHLKIQKTTTIY
jgi:AAA+ lid domain